MRVILLLSFTLCYTQVALEIQNVDTDTGILDIYMINSEPVKGFQFELFGMTLIGISGGLADEYLDFVNYNAATSVILGSSFGSSIIPVGEGVLTQVSFSDYEGYICFGTDPANNVLSDAVGSEVGTDWGDCYGNYTMGCTELSACNYNPDATVDDGSCSYSEENYDCDGNCAVEIDCAGECGGYNEHDSAGECCESWDQDCSGICFGNAVIDCLGNCGGSAVIDECGVCAGDGVWQVCGCGSPDEFGIPDGDCDCDGNVVDCAGLCGKNSVCLSIENVNIVSNILNITMINNQSVGGFQFTLDGIDIESVSGGSSAENGFSIATNPQMILGVSESANAIPTGNGVLTSIYFSNYAGGDICFGSEPEKNIISDEFGYELYSIWGDCYISTEDCDTTYDCAGVCGGDAVVDVCGTCNGSITDATECACPDGQEVDCFGICDGISVVDCSGVCGGTKVNDTCGVCGGDGPAENYDCDGDCTAGVDCSGVCGGTKVNDTCGVCGGDGPAENYDCDGDCTAGVDCAGLCGGNTEDDACGTCGGEVIDVTQCACDGGSTRDCGGVCGGSAVDDECGVCGGAGTLENYNCDLECTAIVDCNGVCGGSAVDDECGVCGGAGALENYNCDLECTAIVDCNGACGGIAVDDVCGICDGAGPAENYNCAGQCTIGLDCNGACGGAAIVDCAGVCDGETTQEDCVACTSGVFDCSGVCGGDAVDDECGVCNGDGPAENYDCSGDCISVIDCTGVCGGNSVDDECGVCNGDGPNTGYDCEDDCVLVVDCFGICGGDATVDVCGTCCDEENGINCIENIIDCDTNGCMQEDACNYNDLAQTDDGSCILPPDNYNCEGQCISLVDCHGVCGGSLLGTGADDLGNDECGICTGTGPPEHYNCLGECIPGVDCNGTCGGTALLDGSSCLGINELVTPDNYSISNIYPNPFNPITNIIYKLPENNTVKITAYDLNGQIIRHLVNEFQTAGIYTVTWKATGYPSGLYFIHMQSGSFYHTKKVVLLK